jgi:flagella basal body P-ring formation protein FlgA
MSPRRRAVRVGAGPLSLMAVAAVLCPPAVAAVAAVAAEQALLERLRQAYPAVTSWQLRRLSRLPDTAPASPAAGGGDVDASRPTFGSPEVKVLGARSRVDIEGTSLWYAVEGMSPALVARRALRRGERAVEGDIVLEARPVFSSRCAALAAWPQTAAPWEIATSRLAGATLCAGDLQRPAAVADGATVDVAVQRGEVVLETRGVALDRAEVGERVRVRVGAGALALPGRVIAPGRVSIDE